MTLHLQATTVLESLTQGDEQDGLLDLGLEHTTILPVTQPRNH